MTDRLVRSRAILLMVLSFGLALPLTSARADDLSGCFPEDCLLFAGTSGIAKVEEAMASIPYGKMLEQPRMKTLASKIDEAFQRLGEMAGSDPDLAEQWKTLQSVLYSPMAFAIMDVDPMEERLEAAAILEAGKHSEAWLSNLDGLMGQFGMQAEEGTIEIEGHPFRRMMLPDFPFPVVYGRAGTKLIAGVGVESVARVIVRLRGQGAKPLSANPAYHAAMTRILPGGADTASTLMINVPRMLQMALRAAEDSGQPLPAPAKALLSEGGVDRVGAFVLTSGIAKGAFQSGALLPIRDLSAATTTVSDSELRLVPRDALYFCTSEVDLLEAFQYLRTLAFTMAGEEKSEIQRYLGGAQAMLGTTFEELFAGMGKRFLVFEEPGMRGLLPSVVLAIEPNDPTPVKRVAASLTALAGIAAGQEGVRVQTRKTTVGEHTIEYIHIAGAPSPVAPAWVESGGRMMFALHPAILEETLLRLAADEPSILDQPAFVEQRRQLPKNISSLRYVDSPRLLGYFYPSVVPLLQSALAMGPEIGLDVDASLIPSSRFLAKYLSPDVAGGVREDGYCYSVNRASTPYSGAAVVGLVAGLWLGTAGAAMAPMRKAQEQAKSVELLTHLQIFWHVAMVHRNEHGVFPDSLDELFRTAKPGALPSMTVSDAKARFGWRPVSETGTLSNEVVLLWELSPGEDGRCGVAFTSGEVGRMTAHELHERLQRQSDSSARDQR
ncbi:MAG: hypothetical protein AAF488_09340 [Planctomycetota bacterium]